MNGNMSIKNKLPIHKIVKKQKQSAGQSTSILSMHKSYQTLGGTVSNQILMNNSTSLSPSSKASHPRLSSTKKRPLNQLKEKQKGSIVSQLRPPLKNHNKQENSLRNSTNGIPSSTLSKEPSERKTQDGASSMRNSLRSSMVSKQPTYSTHSKKKKSIRTSSLSSGKCYKAATITHSQSKPEDQSMKVTAEYLKDLSQVTQSNKSSAYQLKQFKETAAKQEHLHLVGGAS